MKGQQTAQSLRSYLSALCSRIERVKRRLMRPLTYAEKIIFANLFNDSFTDENGDEIVCGRSFINLSVNHVAMQDATAQMVIHQFACLGKPVQVPTTVHLDHLIKASMGVLVDLEKAISENEEVYTFLQSAASRYGIGFWGPGSGIIHQVVAENYAFPGGVLIGTDSHTVNAGGLGMLAIGVGGPDAVDVIAGEPFNVLMPRIIGVNLKGTLSGWTSAKDVIIKLLEKLTVSGGTNAVVEVFGSGLSSISATGRMTISNMGAEYGATATLFPYDINTANYFEATGRASWVSVMNEFGSALRADPEVLIDTDSYFDQVIEIDLSELEPQVAGPHSPDLVRSVKTLASMKHEIPNVSQALIGSCTNSSYQDLKRAASVLLEAETHGLKLKVPLSINCGSQTILDTIRAEGLLDLFERSGAVVMANACGGCIGQWQRTDGLAGEPNVIVSSFNRNFAGRNDGSKKTQSFLASPEMVIAYAIAGTLNFNPETDYVPGTVKKLSVPFGDILPHGGLKMSDMGYIEPPEPMQNEIVIRPGSERLAALAPFDPWDGHDFLNLPVLVVAKGKCTTDHISAGGDWLRYRGHLGNISHNTYMRVTNPWTGIDNDALNVLSGERATYSSVAQSYQRAGLRWVVIGDNNLGEGSSREHAALQPRFLGCAAIIVRGNFARIHETNLKKQGILPLRFANPNDYDLVVEGTRLSVKGLSTLSPGKNLLASFHFPSGGVHEFEVTHSMSERQISWFKAGSALNFLKGV